MGTDEVLLPAGVRLLHIGPHKTGTTSIQVALHAGRAALRAQGVFYPGRGTKAGDAVRAVMGSHAPSGRIPGIGEWRALVREADAAGTGRVIVSNEFLSEAPHDVIRTIANDLGPTRIHVTATLRPLERILPSQWQQFVQSGLTTTFDAWLEQILRPQGAQPNRVWLRHRHDQLVARWAEVVGADRVTVVVVNDRDPGGVFRVFERFLGLPTGALVASPDSRNRAMTWPEIEALRALNLACEAQGMDRRLHYALIQRGVCESMKRRSPEPDEPRVTLPADAAARVAEIAREMIDGIAASGVRVIGDLADLASAPAAVARGLEGPTCINASVSAALSMGVLDALGVASTADGAARPESADLPGISARRIATAIARRPADALGDRLRQVVRSTRGDAGPAAV